METAGEGRDGEESEGEYPNLAQVLYIRYFITFRKKSMLVLALLDSGNKVNTIYSIFARELRLSIRTTDVGVQKIDGTMLDTFGMVVAAFSVMDKANWVRFFEKTFWVANVSPEVVLEIFFLTLSGVDVDFWGRELWWRPYTIQKDLPTTRRVKLMGKKEFAAAAFDLESETFVVYIASLSFDASPSFSPLNIHPSRRPQVSGLITKRFLQRSPPSIRTLRTYSLRIWRPSSSSILELTIML